MLRKSARSPVTILTRLIFPLKYSSENGLGSCKKITTFACNASNSLTSHEPIRPVAPVTRTLRLFQEFVFTKPSTAPFSETIIDSRNAYRAWCPCTARNHYDDRRPIVYSWRASVKVHVQTSSHHC